MSFDSFWIRLDVDYDRAKWLRREKRLVKCAFVDLLRLIKIEAPRKGSIRFREVDDLVFALRYSEDEAWAIARMLECATVAYDDEAPAVTIANGCLTVTNWEIYQSPDALRIKARRAAAEQKALREQGKSEQKSEVQNVEDKSEHVADISGMSQTKDVCTDSLSRVTQTQTNALTTLEQPQAAKGPVSTSRDQVPLIAGFDKKPRVENPDSPFQRAMRVVQAVSTSLNWKEPKSVDITHHLKKDSHIQTLIDQFGETETVALFVFAYRHWGPKATWGAVFRNRNQLAEHMQRGSSPSAPVGGKTESTIDKAHRIMNEAGMTP